MPVLEIPVRPARPRRVTLSQDGELYYLPCPGVGQDTELGAYVMSLA